MRDLPPYYRLTIKGIELMVTADIEDDEINIDHVEYYDGDHNLYTIIDSGITIRDIEEAIAEELEK
jgi:hypothetical protein